MTQTLTDLKLIHIARYLHPKEGACYLALRQEDATYYRWYCRRKESEVATDVGGPSVEEALRLAHREWQHFSFRTVICGFLYTLPERDEHGINALYHQMISSYSSSNGVYFDQELGHNCFVQNASQEALNIWAYLKNEGRLPLP